MTSDTTAPRANKHGDPCPEWCDTDHDRPFADGHTGAVTRSVFKTVDPATSLYPEERRITVFGLRSPACLAVWDAEQADQLAAFLDGIAGMSAEEIREMAAGVRAAAAVFGGAQ
jgi:hypothetical protein